MVRRIIGENPPNQNMPVISSDYNDFGVDRQLSVRAIDRHQSHREPSNIDPIHGRDCRFLVGIYLPFFLRGTEFMLR